LITSLLQETSLKIYQEGTPIGPHNMQAKEQLRTLKVIHCILGPTRLSTLWSINFIAKAAHHFSTIS